MTTMTSVKVAVRVRPRNEREHDSATIIEMCGRKTRLFNPRVSGIREKGDSGRQETKVREFTFDHSFWSAGPADPHFVTQKQVFEALGHDVVEAVYEGYNTCVFAYGQTGSGKTFTMMGSQGNPGFIPRFCEELFGKMSDPTCTYKTEISFVEIYNERVRDLLKVGGKLDHNLRIREHPSQGPYVDNLSKHTVVNFESVIQLIKKGNINRVTASTQMNDTSSRSHAIFTITFTQAKLRDGRPSERQSKINLVDLAGSERANASGSTGVRLKEGGNINKSLVTLGNVISALAEMAERPRSRRSSVFIPYRDSKLTYLLKDSLGGNTKTIMIATISPSALNHGESLSTLRYANRAKNIVNRPTVNEDPNVRLICELREEIARLKAQLAASADLPVTPSVHKELHEKEVRMKELTDEWTDKWRQAASILQEEGNLELRKAGRGVVLDSSHPHLVSLEDDVLSTGVVLYHLKEGLTKLGTEQSEEIQDIVLCGDDVQADHSVIEFRGGEVTLHPIEDASCFVNGVAIKDPVKLNQGALIQLGKNNVFRFNYPAEAVKLKEMRKSLSTLSLSKSPLLSPSQTSLFSRSVTELYLSNDSLVPSPSMNRSGPVVCNTSVNTQDVSMEAQTTFREQEAEWQEQQRLLEEKLSSKEKQLAALQDCLQVITQSVSPYRQVERAMQRLEEKEHAHLLETQATREQLVQAMQELGMNLSVSESSLQMALTQLEQLVTARQVEITGLKADSELRCKALKEELQREKEKAAVVEGEVAALRKLMEEEKQQQLLSEGGPLTTVHTQPTQSLHCLRQEENQVRNNQVRCGDQERNNQWNAVLSHLHGSPSHTQQGQEQDDRVNNNNSGGSNTHAPQQGGKRARQREREAWLGQKERELRQLGRRHSILLHSHERRMADLRQQAEAKEAEMRAQWEKCEGLSEAMRALDSQVALRVQELQEEQRELQEVQARKVQEQVGVAQETAQGQQQIECRLRELQESADNQVDKIRRERERQNPWQEVCLSGRKGSGAVMMSVSRLLGLQQLLRVRVASEPGDAMPLTVSDDSAFSSAGYVERKERELHEKAQRCQELQEKIRALEQDLTKAQQCQKPQEDQRPCHTYATELERQKCLLLNAPHVNSDSDSITALVEQEVRRRLCEDEAERQRQRQWEKRQQQAETDWKIQRLKKHHQDQLDLLTSTLNSDSATVCSSSIQTQATGSSRSQGEKLVYQLMYGPSPQGLEITVPRYAFHGSGRDAHHEYEVKVKIGAETWSVFRRYSRFRELHQKMKKQFPEVRSVPFPGRRLFHKTEKVAAERRIKLECYLRQLIKLCQEDRRSPLHPDNHLHLTKHLLAQLDPFFRRGLFDSSRHVAR
ncbi:kinesin-like protein KIF16B isoform X2 [Babylonia areolata]|uniref:kinesin-like protein KIF16B isoform X2 n=1 Tax=Babylonia areolata TaxID=304850 RepID=UPI003FD5792A